MPFVLCVQYAANMAHDELKSWIFPKGSGIRLRPKINSCGKDAFNISYAVNVPSKITGSARKRKQFTSKQQAEQWASEQWNGAKKQGEIYFEATSEERNEFANILPKLREAGLSLREVVEFALPRLLPEGGDRTLREIVEELRASKLRMLERNLLRERSERTFRLLSGKIVDEFGEKLVRNLTLLEVKLWLKTLGVAPRTLKNQLNCLSEVLRYAMSRKYTSENILDGLVDIDRRELYGVESEVEPSILTVTEATRLLEAALGHPELDLLAAVTLALFCGLRTEEIKRLEWKDVHLSEGFVTINSTIAKKRRIRNVTVPENAYMWLMRCPDRSGAVTRSSHYNDYQKRFQRLLKHAGFVEQYEDKQGRQKQRVAWKKNAMRHSFGSYHFAMYADSIKTSNELGHKQGDNVLFSHYRALSTKEKSEQYFKIVPLVVSEKIVEFVS